jgi:hypothetical protein
MKAEVTWDLIMDEDMSFVEGCYRLEGGDWQVFIFASSEGNGKIEVRNGLSWASGVTGLNAFVPANVTLNKASVLAILSETLGVTEWSEVRGPDSIVLR